MKSHHFHITWREKSTLSFPQQELYTEFCRIKRCGAPPPPPRPDPSLTTRDFFPQVIIFVDIFLQIHIYWPFEEGLMHSRIVNCSEMFTWKFSLTIITSIWTVSPIQWNDRISHPGHLIGNQIFSKRAKIAINLGLQMARVLCCVIIKVIGATTRTRVASLPHQ